jgi:GntR family transcriptional regulator
VLDDSTPIYRQIAERLRGQILRGELAADERVMSTNEVAAFFRINPATVAKAFAELVDEGLLYKRRGIGMFVHPEAHEVLRASRRERFLEERVVPLVEEAVALGLTLDEVVTLLERAAAVRPEEVPT